MKNKYILSLVSVLLSASLSYCQQTEQESSPDSIVPFSENQTQDTIPATKLTPAQTISGDKVDNENKKTVVIKTKTVPVEKPFTEHGIGIDFGVGYPLPLGNLNNFASNIRSIYISGNIYYAINKNFKVGLQLSSSAFVEKKGEVTLSENLYSISGVAINNISSIEVALGGEYSYKFSQYARPYVGLYLGTNFYDTTTQIGTYTSYMQDKWLFCLQPEIGFRSFFDKRESVGIFVKVQYNQSFGKINQVVTDILNPSQINFAAGLAVKI